jgi:hypothetical protein
MIYAILLVQQPPPQSDFPVGRPRQREFDVLRGNQIIGGQAKCQRPSLDQNRIGVLVNILYRVGSVPDPADRLGILVRCLISDPIYDDHLGSQTLGAPYSVPYN